MYYSYNKFHGDRKERNGKSIWSCFKTQDYFSDDFNDVPEFTIPGKLEIEQEESTEQESGLADSSSIALADSSSMVIEEVDMDSSNQFYTVFYLY